MPVTPTHSIGCLYGDILTDVTGIYFPAFTADRELSFVVVDSAPDPKQT